MGTVQASAGARAGEGLTTTKAPFIEQAQASGKLYIHQPYELYSEANQQTWARLFSRMQERWHKYANKRFLQGIENLCLDPKKVPHLEDVNRFMAPRTGFRAKPVSGYVPAYLFFDCLRQREFPTTITIRDGSSLDYLPEPDIFHDIAGHVPKKIVQVTDLPRTISGKISELAVREVVHGRPVRNGDALANPASLALFRDLPELQS